MTSPFSLARFLSLTPTVTIIASACLAASSQPRPVVPDQYRKQMQQKENQQVTQDDAATAARDSVQQLLNRASDTQRLVARLAETAKALFSQMQTLLDSDEGKRIARDPVAFMTYYELDKYPPVTMPQIQAHADAISAHVNRLKLLADAKQATVVPTQETRDQISELNFWANDRLVAVETQQATLNAILRRAPTAFDPATASTLRPVLDDFKARWYQLLSTSGILARERAAEEVKERLVNANYLAELERAANDERRIREDMKADIAKSNAEHDAAILGKLAESNRLRAEAEQQYKKDMEDLQRQLDKANADLEQARRIAKIKLGQQMNEVEHQELIAKAQSPEVQRLLAPFLAQGYWQPGQRMRSYTKGPMSLDSLKKARALVDDATGLRNLLEIGTAAADKDRPRWAFHKNYNNLTPSEHEKLLQAQQYLIELGDILVELRLLTQ